MKHKARTAEASIHQFPEQSKRKLKLKIDDLNVFDPLTKNQSKFFELYKQGAQAIMLHGAAGTGKTFIALYKALEEVMDRSNPYQKVVLVRSVVPSREIGHLPGDEKEKTDVYVAPYKAICQDLFNTEQAYERLVEQKNVEFMITSFVRGITIDNAVIIVDECQNMNFQELSSIITRVGENSKIIFCGDFKQTDLCKKHDQSGLKDFVEVVNKMPSFRNVEFGIEDIVRSSLVKEFIVANLHIQSIKS
jgi:phosphate starvation-inducible protein PhoH and related proteins